MALEHFDCSVVDGEAIRHVQRLISKKGATLKRLSLMFQPGLSVSHEFDNLKLDNLVNLRELRLFCYGEEDFPSYLHFVVRLLSHVKSAPIVELWLELAAYHEDQLSQEVATWKELGDTLGLFWPELTVIRMQVGRHSDINKYPASIQEPFRSCLESIIQTHMPHLAERGVQFCFDQ